MRKKKRDKISGLPEKEKPLGFFSGIAVLANKTIYRRTSGASRGRGTSYRYNADFCKRLRCYYFFLFLE